MASLVKRARLTATCLIVAAVLCSACDRKGHQQRQFYAFGTIVTLHTYGTSTSEADKAVAALEPYYQTITDNGQVRVLKRRRSEKASGE